MNPENKRQELLDAIAANETLNHGSQTTKRKATLTPSHIVKEKNRIKNRIARKSRKANKLGKGKIVPKPTKKHGTYISLRPQRHIESEVEKNCSQKEVARHNALVKKRMDKENLAEATRRLKEFRAENPDREIVGIIFDPKFPDTPAKEVSVELDRDY